MGRFSRVKELSIHTQTLSAKLLYLLVSGELLNVVTYNIQASITLE
jgi:hypothetical protein